LRTLWNSFGVFDLSWIYNLPELLAELLGSGRSASWLEAQS
jgi:hypothetical protein